MIHCQHLSGRSHDLVEQHWLLPFCYCSPTRQVDRCKAAVLGNANKCLFVTSQAGDATCSVGDVRHIVVKLEHVVTAKPSQTKTIPSIASVFELGACHISIPFGSSRESVGFSSNFANLDPLLSYQNIIVNSIR